MSWLHALETVSQEMGHFRPQITEVYGVLGEYDLFLKVWCRSLDELKVIINDNIRSLQGIEDLHEIIVMERAKEEMPPV